MFPGQLLKISLPVLPANYLHRALALRGHDRGFFLSFRGTSSNDFELIGTGDRRGPYRYTCCAAPTSIDSFSRCLTFPLNGIRKYATKRITRSAVDRAARTRCEISIAQISLPSYFVFSAIEPVVSSSLIETKRRIFQRNFNYRRAIGSRETILVASTGRSVLSTVSTLDARLACRSSSL